jgi:hypothetical protein
MDYFTKWPEAYALPNQEAATVAEVLVTDFFCRFGIPRELHSDQGRNFESRLLQEIFQRLRVSKTRTTPLHQHQNGRRTPTKGRRVGSEGLGREITPLSPSL